MIGKIIEAAIEGHDVATAIIFTAGSCKGYPGPCRAEACVFLQGQEGFELEQPVSCLSIHTSWRTSSSLDSCGIR